jgi:translation elongation factor EF-G
MTNLLGFPADLRSATEDRANHWITFNHWRPIELSPDTAAWLLVLIKLEYRRER